MNGLKEMALEAGGKEMVSALTHPNGPTTAIKFHVENGSLEAFAKLVAAKEREAIWNILFEYAGRDDLTPEDESLLKHLADLIKARGET